MADQARPASGAGGDPSGGDAPPPDDGGADRRRRRAAFLRELEEARRLRARVAPLRSKVARERRAVRMRTFRY